MIALREIAELTVSGPDLREDMIASLQHHVEIDEPEAVAAPVLPDTLRPKLGRDSPSLDTAIDTMTEEALLRAMEQLLPQEPSAGPQSDPELRREGGRLRPHYR